MKKIIFVLTLLALLTPSVHASTKKRKVVKAPIDEKSSAKMTEDKKPPERSKLEAWIKQMRKRLAKTHARQNQLVAVAAVRGDEAADAAPLYWKGKVSKGPVEMSELQEFESTLDTAMGDDPVLARQKLETFIAKYPKSSLSGDAQETLSRLNESTPAQ